MELISAGNGMSPAWSPDGAWIAFLSNRAEGWDLYVAPAAGGDPQRLTKGATADDPAWRSDGLAVAVHRRAGIDLAPLDGTPPQRFDETATQAAWSRDSRIAIIRDGRLALQSCGNDVETEIDARDPAWAPDGRRLAVTRASGIEIVDAETGETQPLEGGQRGAAPAWHPSGDRIAFERDDGIQVANLGAGTMETLPTPMPAGKPSWSPSGDEIAFHAYVDANWNILILNLASGHVRPLTAATWASWNARG